MHIFIPSRGRSSKQEFLRSPIPLLPAEWLRHTTLVLHESEKYKYHDWIGNLSAEYGMGVLSFDYDGIAEKRTKIGQWAEKLGYKKFLMLDDDINFLRRKEADTAAQVTMTEPSDINLMLMNIEQQLDNYAQVALGLREVNKTNLIGPMPLIEECGKCMRAVAYQTAVFREMSTMRVRTMSDYDTTLQILESGRKNAIMHFWMSGQRSTQAPGGCSIWRTRELHEESVDRMVQLHPGLVTKRVKKALSGGDISERAELTVYWKKAYKQGVKNVVPTPNNV